MLSRLHLPDGGFATKRCLQFTLQEQLNWSDRSDCFSHLTWPRWMFAFSIAELLQALSRCLLNTERHGASTTSLNSLLQGLALSPLLVTCSELMLAVPQETSTCTWLWHQLLYPKQSGLLAAKQHLSKEQLVKTCISCWMRSTCLQSWSKC